MNERSEEAIRERIEETRARLGNTIEEIGDRVNPDRVKAELKARAREQVDEVKNNMKRKARNTMRNVEQGVNDTGRGIWAAIRENPLPAGMVGVGLAWMFANRRSSSHEHRFEAERYRTRYEAVPYRTGYAEPSYSESYGTGRTDYGYNERIDGRGTTGFETTTGGAQWGSSPSMDDDRGLRDKAAEVVHSAKDRIGSIAHDAQERVGSVAHGAQERVSNVAHGAQERVSSVARGARDRARDLEHRVEDRMRENPLAAGAVALAIGMAAGMLIPESEQEHRMMGESRDRLLDRAQDAARRASGKLHDAARDRASESARNAVDEMWPVADGDSNNEGYSEPRRT